jgi:hypothetical protein
MEPSEIDAILEGAKKPETTVKLCLRSDLQNQWEKLERELQEEDQAEAPTLAKTASKRAKELAEQVRDLQAQMEKSTVVLTLRAMDRAPWKELRAEHPPRPGSPMDWRLQFNEETFYDALIAKSIVDAEWDDADRVKKLLDSLTAGQFDNLANEAWTLNRSDVSAPFSATASRIAASSAGTSKRRPA